MIRPKTQEEAAAERLRQAIINHSTAQASASSSRSWRGTSGAASFPFGKPSPPAIVPENAYRAVLRSSHPRRSCSHPLVVMMYSTHFRECDYRMRSYSCLDQSLCMAFARLTYRESLRDIEICLRAVQVKLYHAGFRGRLGADRLRLRLGGISTCWLLQPLGAAWDATRSSLPVAGSLCSAPISHRLAGDSHPCSGCLGSRYAEGLPWP